MVADVGKVYPPEIHLLKKEIEVQGELINSERLERKAEIDGLRLEVAALKRLLEGLHPGFLERYEESYAFEKQAWNPETRESSGLKKAV